MASGNGAVVDGYRRLVGLMKGDSMAAIDDALAILNDPSCNSNVSAFRGHTFVASDFPPDTWTIHVDDGCLVMFFRTSAASCNIHLAFLPDRRGLIAARFSKRALDATFADPAMDSIVAFFPSRLTQVRAMADRFGFVPMGSSLTQEQEPWERSVLTRSRHARWDHSFLDG